MLQNRQLALDKGWGGGIVGVGRRHSRDGRRLSSSGRGMDMTLKNEFKHGWRVLEYT